jgi:hypothetical protein
MSAMDFLKCNDPFTLLIYQAVTEQVFRLMDERDQNLAQRIANCVSEMFKQ